MRGEVLGNQQSIEKTILLLCFTYSYFRKRKAEEEEEEAQQKKINAEWAKNFEVSERLSYNCILCTVVESYLCMVYFQASRADRVSSWRDFKKGSKGESKKSKKVKTPKGVFRPPKPKMEQR